MNYLSAFITQHTLVASKNYNEKIIQDVDPHKGQDHEKISIHMIKICSKSICKSFQLIFNKCIDTGSIPFFIGKKSIKFQFKEKQCLENYQT